MPSTWADRNARRHDHAPKGSRLERPLLDQEKFEAAVLLVKSGMSPTKVAGQIRLDRSMLYRELRGKSLA
jgi:hypothetical protein